MEYWKYGIMKKKRLEEWKNGNSGIMGKHGTIRF
jgi:hypothetical protein